MADCEFKAEVEIPADFDVAAHLGMAYVTFSVRAKVITDLGQEEEWH